MKTLKNILRIGALVGAMALMSKCEKNDLYEMGTQAWSNPDYARTEDSSYATVNLFAVLQAPVDYSVRIVKGGVITGDDLATFSKLPGLKFLPFSRKYKWKQERASEIDIHYGGSTSLWGETWTPKDINDAGFGFVYSVFGPDYDKLSHYLKASNFGFSIPEEATIDGIEAIVTCFQNISSAEDVKVNYMQIKVYSPQGTWVSVDKR